jgi:hypothetical protein
MLKAHSQVAVSTLESLSKKQAKQVAKARQKLKELPWDIAIKDFTSAVCVDEGLRFSPRPRP